MNDISNRPLVSIIIPAYNEGQILEKNLYTLYEYTQSLSDKYLFELILINDGSTDATGEIADAFSRRHDNMHVLHHLHNFRMGQALRTGFAEAAGDYIVVMDIDLSYSPDHIEAIVDKLVETGAEVVVASPYMKGGKVSNVPWLRKQLSYWANLFLSLTATKDHLCNICTLTGMVRGYDADFLQSLNLKAMDVDLNTEIIYKSMILRARILEVPAHLSWRKQSESEVKRSSSLRILRAVLSSLVSGFTFRPFMFFILPGFLVLLVSLYPFYWLLVHTFNYYHNFAHAENLSFMFRFSDSVAIAFSEHPHVFIIGGFSLMIAIQLMSLGILALQKKKYFEELFHITSMLRQQIRKAPMNKAGKYHSPINRCHPRQNK